MSVKSILCIATLCIISISCSAKLPTEDRTVITWWQFWAEPYQKPIVRELINEFEELHPRIKIEMTELTWSGGHDKIVASFASGRAPDMLELGSDWIYEFASRDVLADVSSEATKIKDDFLGWESCQDDSQTFGFPWMLGSRVIFYNKQLVANDSIHTWDELLAAVKKAHNPDHDIYGFGNTKKEPHQLYKKILPFFWSNGGDVLSPDKKTSVINSKENIEALEYYLKLCEYGLLESQKNLDDKFAQGHIGFVFSGGWLIKKIADQNPGLNYGAIMFPQSKKDQRSFSFFGGEYLVINKQSTKKDSAVEFIRFLMKKENALKLCDVSKVTLPASKALDNDSYYEGKPIEKILFEQLQTSRPSPIHSHWIKIETVIEDEIEYAIYKKKTAKQALDDAHKRLQLILSTP